MRVITLPPGVAGEAALGFADAAQQAGAEALELRSDLHAATDVDAGALASVLPLLAARRGKPVPDGWLRAARWLDVPLDHLEGAGPSGELVVSQHSHEAMEPAAAVALWQSSNLPPIAAIKHVEPLGPLEGSERLFETQRRLREAFPERRITVLATGALALPFRCLLAAENALDYLSFGGFFAAEGQRLLEDAVREQRSAQPAASRRAILGTHITHSRSPRIHRQPFDRLDVPAETKIEPLLTELLRHYDGLAVTSPFKKSVARVVGSAESAVNTLVRRERSRWHGFNTDVAGARVALERLGPGMVQVLGDGGATAALRESGRELVVLKRDALLARPLSGLAVWTWPAHLKPPDKLAFRDCRVGMIAYGQPARQIATLIRERGGTPVALGPAWFIAQAREQQRLWDTP